MSKQPENPDQAQEQETLFEFPCEFPLKAMGKTGDELEIAVLEIINRHVADPGEGAVKFRQSSNGKYTSITITFTALSKDHLDKIYLDLTRCEHVLYCI
ncbi:Proposed lipoate regulatory protein YbeD [hydrothermal vent metagenome]|uniref:Proposed lipoate regulatory protein YbeD n=1 Tax=hydrothermal vent metagenome TaxID=652676 RepID=A0A3B0X939_9ZZZZ